MISSSVTDLPVFNSRKTATTSTSRSSTMPTATACFTASRFKRTHGESVAGLEAGIVVLFRVAKLFGHLRLQPLGVEFVRKVVVFVDGLAEPRLRLFELGLVLRRGVSFEHVAGRFAGPERCV